MTGAGAIDAARKRALAALSYARQCTRDLLREFPEDAALHQRDATGPHALWIVGHLAVSDEWIEGMIHPLESRLPPKFKLLFGHRSVPHANAAVYPSFSDVIDRFESSRAALAHAVRAAEPDQLTRPLGDEGVGFADDPLDAVNKTAWHEGWHAGQLSRLRHAIGLPGIFSD